MYFGSLAPLYWFAALVAVYWILPWRSARAALLAGVTAFLYFRQYGWHMPVEGSKGDIVFFKLPFLAFFAPLFCIYWTLPWHQARVWLLLAASYFFYAAWSPQLAFIVFGSTLMDYTVARGMDALAAQRWRKLLLVVSLVMNLGLLCYFKYANFFLDSLHTLLRSPGLYEPLKILLPVGISFYTFEAINYTVDVFKRRVPAERNLSHFLLFILFFPHLVAGPIVRARDFLPQIKRGKHWSWPRMQVGVQFFLLGLFKKLAIADRMGMFSDELFKHPGAFNTFATWVGVVAYALQIYGDFSGYTDMALGTAHLLGYRLAKNFDMPYLAVNVSDFWRRWHISLSTWLRDYLFIPLGGSRGTSGMVYRNLLITMVLGGLWHGARWTFVAWGLAHGLLLIGHRLLQAALQARPWLDRLLQSFAGTAARRAATFTCVALCWVPFRAPTFRTGAIVLKRLLCLRPGADYIMPYAGFWLVVSFVVVGHLAGHFDLWKRIQRLPAPALGATYALALSLVLLLNPDASQAFIYFQF